MRNRKFYPFERNNYYYGKLLAARDFEAEQQYFNDKRRFLNSLLHARGVVAGLGVVRADDASVVVQSGCALDALGREIVVPETAVAKLSTLAGYDETESDRVLLGIRYAETPVDQVYGIVGEGEEGGGVRHNKQQEGYELYLMDEASAQAVPALAAEYLTATVLYADEDFRLVQHTPACLTLGSDICVAVELHKLSHSDVALSFSYQLAAPGFLAEGEAVDFQGDNLRLAAGEHLRWEQTLTPGQHLWGEGGGLSLTVGEVALRRDGELINLPGGIQIPLRSVRKTLEEHLLSTWYGRAMEEMLEAVAEEKLWLARISLFRREDSTIIDSITPMPYGQYVYNSALLALQGELRRAYPGTSPLRSREVVPAGEPRPGLTAELSPAPRTTSTGVCDLPLGLGYRPKQTFFTDEIIHGLGRAPVYIDIGVEYVTTGERASQDRSEIILGDTEIFAHEDGVSAQERIHDISLAVKVLPERGTFVVGARVRQVSDLISLRIRWYAFKLDEMSGRMDPGIMEGGYLLIKPDTIVVQPKGTAHLTPMFVGMEPEACSYRVVDVEGGSIDMNGVYTAPAKEGVYEIRVQAVSNPTVFAHAFAIVSQQKKESGDK